MALFVEEDLSAYRHDPDAQSVLATLLGQRESLRPFRFDCGVDDLLIEHNRSLAHALTEAGVSLSLASCRSPTSPDMSAVAFWLRFGFFNH